METVSSLLELLAKRAQNQFFSIWKTNKQPKDLYVIESNHANMEMETLQIRLPEEQVKDIDSLVRQGIYASRSEAIRTMLRELDAIRETFELMGNPELVKQVRAGLKEIEEGKGIPLEDV